MKKYSTEQRKYLIAFLQQNIDRQFFIEEIETELLKSYNVSRSAIYRNISQMVSEGVVKKFASKDSRKSLYQYIGESECAHHLHLKCSVCGKIFHLDHEATEQIEKAARMDVNFQIDTGGSVIYGVCCDCRSKMQKEQMQQIKGE